MTQPSEPPILDKIRSMWEFAAVTQFFNLFYYMFGLNDFDIYVLISPRHHRQMQKQGTDRA